eukprot:scaffold12670_cov119-Isochrysis_galbana.AAC.5
MVGCQARTVCPVVVSAFKTCAAAHGAKVRHPANAWGQARHTASATLQRPVPVIADPQRCSWCYWAGWPAWESAAPPAEPRARRAASRTTRARLRA